MNTLLAILKVTDARRDVILAGGLYYRLPWRDLPPWPNPTNLRQDCDMWHSKHGYAMDIHGYAEKHELSCYLCNTILSLYCHYVKVNLTRKPGDRWSCIKMSLKYVSNIILWLKTIGEAPWVLFPSEWKLTGFLYQKTTKITVHIFKNNCSIIRSKYSLTDSIISLSQEISLITDSFSLQSDRAASSET